MDYKIKNMHTQLAVSAQDPSVPSYSSDPRMLQIEIQRFLTITEDDAFPCKRSLQHTDGSLWWDLDYLFLDLLKHGEPRAHKAHWLRWVRRILTECALLAGTVHMYIVSKDVQVGLNTEVSMNICNSLALLVFLCHNMRLSRGSTIANRCQRLVATMCRRACEAVVGYDVVVLRSGHALPVTRSGLIHGFRQIADALHAKTAQSVRSQWDYMFYHGLLETEFDEANHTIVDVLNFVVLLPKLRKIRKMPPLSGAAQQLLQTTEYSVLKWLAEHIDQYVLNCYTTLHDVNAIPPAKCRAWHGALGRKHQHHSPEEVWDILQKAPKASVSAAQSAVVMDAKRSGACLWALKLHDMYLLRARMGFFAG